MIDLTGVSHHPAMQEIVAVLQNKTQNTDFGFYRVEVAYFLSKIAACMRVSIVTKDRGEIPVNTYALALAPSGYGKGYSVSIMENEFLAGFQQKFVDVTMPLLAEVNLQKMAKDISDRSIGTIDEVTQEDAYKKLATQYEKKGKYLFTFDSGSGPAVKQLRQKLLMAKSGSINCQVDEIGLNLANSVEILTLFLELYDLGMVKEKITKNSEENQRDDELVGKTPTNMLIFGTPSKLLDGAATEDHFFSLLDTGYARRCLFGWGEISQDRAVRFTGAQVFQQLTNPQNNLTVAKWAALFTNLADHSKFGWKLVMEDDVAIKLIDYKLACEEAALKLPSHAEIQKAELTHRYFKALKLAGAYAFIDSSSEVEMDHLLQAILLVEESGNHFKKLLTREKAYVRLAKYICEVGSEVTHADLDEALSFYKRGARHEQMQLAQAWGSRNNYLITKTYENGIEFFKGKSLKVTDLSKLIVSHSQDVAFDYKPGYIAFDKMHMLCTMPDTHWANHFFNGGHRSENTTIQGFNLLVIDVDEGPKILQVINLLAQWKFYLHTTKRHTPTDNRFRVVIPLKYELEMDQDTYHEFMEGIMTWIPFQVDSQANQRSRKWQTQPLLTEDLTVTPPVYAGYHYYSQGTEVFDPLKFIPKTSMNDQYSQEYKAIENYSSLERWFAMRSTSGTRNNMLLRFAMTLVDGGHSLQDVEKKVLAFNDKVQPSLTKAEIASTVMVTVSKRYMPKKP